MTTARVSSARVDAAFHHSIDPIFLIGNDRRFLYVNHAWEQLTGRGSEEVLAWNPVQSSTARTEALASLIRSFSPPLDHESGDLFSRLTLIEHRDGARLWRRLEFRRMRQAGESMGCWLGFVSDPNAASQTPDPLPRQLRYQLLQVSHQQESRFGLDQVVGKGPAHDRLLEQIRVAGQTESPVTIIGPQGTGKRFLARVIHQQSLRRHGSLVPLDCALLPPVILERELFETSKTAPKLCCRRDATLLLLNASELHRDLQARLVASLAEGPRLVATSPVDLEPLLSEGRLCEDFYYGLTTQQIVLRPLSQRRTEIGLLAQVFLERAAARTDRGSVDLDSDALETLESYSWPGNLTELARVMDAALASCEGTQLGLEHLPGDVRGHQAESTILPAITMESLDELMTRVERRLIEQALARSQQNKSKAADLLGISRPRLYRRIRELGMPEEPEKGREGESGS